ncbi:NAD-dependent epimerase/dehydratase family protein [Pseudonocardia xishanensis]|uniref:NAD-dependent epimerase/dehydratase family protein n=1 Tax=Pseudonocardia xishanensis TaxID=630995 RepID=A0ABP8S314_9PSEU
MPTTRPRVVVTGATGNVGVALLRRIAEAGTHDVVGVCRHLPDPVPPFDSADWTSVDLAAPEAPERLRATFAGADAVVHLAWLIQPEDDAEGSARVNLDGTRAVLDAVAATGVPHVVFMSSVAVYAESPGGVPVAEDGARPGIDGSEYSAQKVRAEVLLDEFEAAHPDTVVTRLRAGLIVQREAAQAITAEFLGRLPGPVVRALRRGAVPLVPLPRGLFVQLVHSDDIADATWRAVQRRAPGAYNVTADALDVRGIAAVVGARAVPLPARVVGALVRLLHAARLSRMTPGWFAMMMGKPVADGARAHDLLGWVPRHSTTQAARDLLDGLAEPV